MDGRLTRPVLLVKVVKVVVKVRKVVVKVRKVVVKVLTEQRLYKRQGSADYDSAERQRRVTETGDI